MEINRKKEEKPLPDILKRDLWVLFVGFNPSLKSAEEGHHYAGKSNRFWKLLHESGLTPIKLDPYQDRKLLDYGYGSTNIVSRPTKGADEITHEEYEQGIVSLKNLLIAYRPKIACYVGVGVYKNFSKKKSFSLGLQPEPMVEGVIDYVCSSSSGLNRTPIEKQLACYKGLNEILKELKDKTEV